MISAVVSFWLSIFSWAALLIGLGNTLETKLGVVLLFIVGNSKTTNLSNLPS